jgi:hypothetical protein
VAVKVALQAALVDLQVPAQAVELAGRQQVLLRSSLAISFRAAVLVLRCHYLKCKRVFLAQVAALVPHQQHQVKAVEADLQAEAVLLELAALLPLVLAVLATVQQKQRYSLDGHTTEMVASSDLSSTSLIALFKLKQSVCRISESKLVEAWDLDHRSALS